MLKMVERPVTKKPVVKFYTKVGADRIPVVWRRTEESLIHATIDGRAALCAAEVTLKMHNSGDQGDLSRHLLTCKSISTRTVRYLA